MNTCMIWAIFAAGVWGAIMFGAGLLAGLVWTTRQYELNRDRKINEQWPGGYH